MRLNNLWLTALTRIFTLTTGLCIITHINTLEVAARSLSTPAEQWILKQVAAGEGADLKKNFPQDADRVISPSFVKRLLTNKSVSIRPYEVRISNAIINSTGHLPGVTCRFISFWDGF